jgi:hypothetical protein
MIDPQLEDWWSRRRLTEIRHHDSSLSGAGVSLRVILPAFSDSKMVWYSMVYGGWDDNILLLGCGRNTVSSFEHVEYKETSPVQAIYKDAFPDEYVLTDSIRSTLGIRFEGNSFFIDHEDKIAYQVYIHDNCFFYIKPVEDALLGKLLNCIFMQHSFYLEQEIDWSSIVPEIVKQLLTLGRIEMQSDLKRQCLWIPQLEERRHLFWKLFRQGTVLIENGKASFKQPPNVPLSWVSVAPTMPVSTQQSTDKGEPKEKNSP